MALVLLGDRGATRQESFEVDNPVDDLEEKGRSPKPY
jgi:hypothetical protein